MMDDFLSLRNVGKTYAGVQALMRVDFTVRKGDIHCIVGENGSGKSTLMKIIAGTVQPDPGAEIVVENKAYRKLTPLDAVAAGIQVIYQDLSLFPNLTIAENVSLNQYLEERKKTVNRNAFFKVAKETMAKIGADLDPLQLVGELPIAKQQLVAICRALTRGEKLIIMDEPTSSLGKRDVEHLLSIIRNLKSRGISILFVGHKLDEVFEIADRVTVLRDGIKIGTFDVVEIDRRKLIELMTGRDIVGSGRKKRSGTNAKPVLEVKDLSKKGHYSGISFTVSPGEIVGLAGRVGSGRTEVALSLFGLNPPDSGEIYIDGVLRKKHSVREAMKLGIGYVPEDRLTQGLFMEHSVGRNLIVTILKSLLSRTGLLNHKKIQTNNKAWIKELSIKTSSAELPVKQLSGGNQQRVVLSKWMARNPKILILDGPTIGVDVGAKEEIHRIVGKLAEKGIGIIMISDEASEVLQHSDRILLMKEGKILSEFDSMNMCESE